jgi:hypothetical protein
MHWAHIIPSARRHLGTCKAHGIKYVLQVLIHGLSCTSSTSPTFAPPTTYDGLAGTGLHEMLEAVTYKKELIYSCIEDPRGLHVVQVR